MYRISTITWITLPIIIGLGFTLLAIHPIGIYRVEKTECESIENKNIISQYQKPPALGSMPDEDWRFLINRALELNVDPSLAEDIIVCESGGQPFIKNPYSSAHGYFQIIDSTALRAIRDMPELNLEIGLRLLKKDGTRHWEESKSCFE